MRLRIMTNGVTYKVEQKKGWFHDWVHLDENGSDPGPWGSGEYFSTEKAARTFIEDMFGQRGLLATDDAQWRAI
jgi:hypothetical protein